MGDPSRDPASDVVGADAASDLRVAPRRFNRGRIAFFRAAETLVRIGGGRAWHRRCLSPGRLRRRDEEVASSRLPVSLDGLRLLVLSDLHAGPFLGPGDLGGVRAHARDFDPDLILLIGDYVAHRVEEALPLAPDLLDLVGDTPAFAVFGNHDYKSRDEQRIVDALAPRVRFLRNEHALFERGEARLALVGLEDLEEGKVIDVDAARRGLPSDCFEVVLSHNCGAAPALARLGSDLVLSGHTHGGQVDLPFLRRLGPPHPGVRVSLGPTTLLVSRGVGVVGLPLRVGAPAEVLCVTLRALPGS